MTERSRRVLVVENGAISRGAVSKWLDRHECEDADAVSVKAAITRFNLNEFDLIISDLRVPGGSGAELISLAGAVPVLIMTSYDSLRSAVDIMPRTSWCRSAVSSGRLSRSSLMFNISSKPPKRQLLQSITL